MWTCISYVASYLDLMQLFRLSNSVYATDEVCDFIWLIPTTRNQVQDLYACMHNQSEKHLKKSTYIIIFSFISP